MFAAISQANKNASSDPADHASRINQALFACAFAGSNFDVEEFSIKSRTVSYQSLVADADQHIH